MQGIEASPPVVAGGDLIQPLCGAFLSSPFRVRLLVLEMAVLMRLIAMDSYG